MSASREKQLRQERANTGSVDPKAALAAEKRSKEKRNNLLYGILAAVFVAAIAVTLIWRSNVIQKNATAVTIDGEKYSATEVAFYYQNNYMSFLNQASYYVSYIGLNTSTSLKSQTINETAASIVEAFGFEPATVGQTWHEYFMSAAIKQMTAIQNGLKAAEAEGYVYTDSVETSHSENIAIIQENAEFNGISTDEYLSSTIGIQITEKVYSEQLLRLLKFEDYAQDYKDQQTYSLSDLEAFYAEAPELYDIVSYEAIAVSGMAESTEDADGNTVEPTEEESAAAMEAAKKTADEILAAYKTGTDLESLAAKYEGVTYNKSEDTSYGTGNVIDWLFDDTRKVGDCDVIENGSFQYVLVFQGRVRDDYNTIDVRHILIQPEVGSLTSEDEGYDAEQEKLSAEAKATAEDLLNQWKNGDATEESFAELAKEHSVDGSSSVGGLYTNVTKNQMVAEFEDWCFDEAREPGDSDVVKTTYGYHVMYFVGDNEPYWQYALRITKAEEAYTEWYQGLCSMSTPQQDSFGMKFVV